MIGFMHARRWAAAVGTALLVTSGTLAAAGPPVKPPIRGLVSMGAFRFVGSGGDPVNTLEPLNAKPGIFGGIVIIASWAQLQPTAASDEIEDGNVIDQAMAEVREYNARNPEKPLAVRLRIWGGFKAPGWAMKLGGLHGSGLQGVPAQRARRLRALEVDSDRAVGQPAPHRLEPGSG